MSLDVYLYKEGNLEEWQNKKDASLKEAGSMVGLLPLIEEYYEDLKPNERTVLFSSNITHNLGEMAEAAGIYKHLWRPEEIGITKAKELIEPIEKGLTDMKARPEFYKKYNAPNGWGMYEHFIPWIAEYLTACKKYPEAIVSASR